MALVAEQEREAIPAAVTFIEIFRWYERNYQKNDDIFAFVGNACEFEKGHPWLIALTGPVLTAGHASRGELYPVSLKPSRAV